MKCICDYEGYPDQLKTAYDWCKDGKRPKDGARPKRLWDDEECVVSALYYSADQVQDIEKGERFAVKQKSLRSEKRREKIRPERRHRKYSMQLAEKQKAVQDLDIIKGRTIIIDTETTGLGYGNVPDEIVELSIIDMDGTELYSKRLRPLWMREWPEAARINGIYWKDVENCPTILDEYETIAAIIGTAETIIGYNVGFDLGMLERSASLLIHMDAKGVDTMEPFAEIYGEWNDYFQDYKWQKLVTAAYYVGHEWRGSPHGSLADCFATKDVFEYINKWDEKHGKRPLIDRFMTRREIEKMIEEYS